MTPQAPVIVQNRDGLLGVLEDPETLPSSPTARATVRLTTGRTVLVPVALLIRQPDGSFHLDQTASELAEFETAEATSDGPAQRLHGEGRTRSARGEGTVIPVVAESAEVTKCRVESGRVAIRKTVETTDQVVAETLVREDVEVERIPINRVVDGPVAHRHEGDTLVVPVLKEVLVVEKRLVLVEEIRITRRRTEQPFSQTVSLRTETVAIDRQTGPATPAGSASESTDANA